MTKQLNLDITLILKKIQILIGKKQMTNKKNQKFKMIYHKLNQWLIIHVMKSPKEFLEHKKTISKHIVWLKNCKKIDLF